MKMLLKKLRLMVIILPLTACLYPPFYPEASYRQPTYYDRAAAYHGYSSHGERSYGEHHDHHRREGDHGRRHSH